MSSSSSFLVKNDFLLAGSFLALDDFVNGDPSTDFLNGEGAGGVDRNFSIELIADGGEKFNATLSSSSRHND